MSDELERHVSGGTLLLADRGFWGLACRVEDVLADSYLARIQANKHSKATGTVKAPPAVVRVVEYRIDGQTEVIRLITSLMDHERCPATELPNCTHDAGRSSSSLTRSKPTSATDPFSAHRRRTVFGKEIFAHLIVHHATRDLLAEAARTAQCGATRTSFTRDLNVVRRSVSEGR
ncbi:hypothetical protein [Streptomyces sp. CBMA152]|uniref:hypothetical protein n=1 Tax=Streptomyces sp. CBMA152 TaxID=1896312 RepID=UPI001CB72BA1|nr:hypothetical protein [Streptomyces sp. CBMA152]